jgi:hypothetical protein
VRKRETGFVYAHARDIALLCERVFWGVLTVEHRFLGADVGPW